MFFVEKCQSLGPTRLLLRLGRFSPLSNCIKSGLDLSVGRKSTTMRARLPFRSRGSTAALNMIAIISKIARQGGQYRDSHLFLAALASRGAWRGPRRGTIIHLGRQTPRRKGACARGWAADQ